MVNATKKMHAGLDTNRVRQTDSEFRFGSAAIFELLKNLGSAISPPRNSGGSVRQKPFSVPRRKPKINLQYVYSVEVAGLLMKSGLAIFLHALRAFI